MLRINYLDGYYEGEVNYNNKPHGRGKLVNENGITLSGEFRNGGPYLCTMYKNNVKRFYGYFENGRQKGEGEIYENGRVVAKGYCIDYMLNGKGAKYNSTGFKTEEGIYNDNLIHVSGTYYYPNGQKATFDRIEHHTKEVFGLKMYSNTGILIYEGDFKNSKKHGYGTEYNSNGVRIYEGWYKEGKYHGYGRLQYTDGEYVGYFENGMRHGKGEFRFKDGRITRGTFSNNKFIG